MTDGRRELDRLATRSSSSLDCSFFECRDVLRFEDVQIREADHLTTVEDGARGSCEVARVANPRGKNSHARPHTDIVTITIPATDHTNGVSGEAKWLGMSFTVSAIGTLTAGTTQAYVTTARMKEMKLQAKRTTGVESESARGNILVGLPVACSK